MVSALDLWHKFFHVLPSLPMHFWDFLVHVDNLLCTSPSVGKLVIFFNENGHVMIQLHVNQQSSRHEPRFHASVQSSSIQKACLEPPNLVTSSEVLILIVKSPSSWDMLKHVLKLETCDISMCSPSRNGSPPRFKQNPVQANHTTQEVLGL